MNTLKDYVDFKLTHADKVESAGGYPLTLENCKKNKKMKHLQIYGNTVQNGTPTPDAPIDMQSVGEIVTDENDINYGKYKIPVVSRGINLFDKTKVVEGWINDADGRYNVPTTFYSFASDYIEIEENQQFFISPNTTARMWGAYYDENKQFIKGLYTYGKSHTTPAKTKYIRLTVHGDYLDVFQVQLGSVSTEYEPYIEPVITNIFLDEPLRKLGDYADYIDFKENKVVRNTKEVVFKGGEITNQVDSYIAQQGYIIWRTNTNYATNLCCDYFLKYDKYVQPEKSTHFIAGTSVNSSMTKAGDWHIVTNGRINFQLAPETFASDGVKATIQDINAWLSSQYENGTPVTFNYILKEPTEEPLTLDLPKLNAKTSVIEVDTSLLPSNAQGKYIKK